MDDSDINDLAYDFVLEYLERSPEYLDVVEFADDNAPGDIDELSDEDYGKIYKAVIAKLNAVAKNF